MYKSVGGINRGIEGVCSSNVASGSKIQYVQRRKNEYVNFDLLHYKHYFLMYSIS